MLPGLNYTREQLFFIAFGRQWAENIKPAALVQRVRTDPHSPNEFRVDGTLTNVPEFAEAFNCPVGSKVRFCGSVS
jgi:endothelin-converting enzyme